jgi:AmpE protein
MTIIAILIAFILCHFVRELRRLRRYEWVSSFINFSNETFKKIPGWSGPVGFLFIIGLPLLAAYFLNSLLSSVMGQLGEFTLAIVILILTFGPRDLDIDVRRIFTADNEEEQKEALETLLGGPAPEDPEACQTAAINAVFLGLPCWVYTVPCFIVWQSGSPEMILIFSTSRKNWSPAYVKSWSGRLPS